MKGWLDNFGKADNANDSKVSMSEDFVGLGYNTEGRNYSPAWGGQFEEGGIIPSAQNGVSEYMKKKIQEKKDESISAQYNLPEVVVEAPYLTEYNDPNKPTGFPQYEAKSNDIAEFYKSWVSSPEYERRMKNTGYYETPTYNGIRKDSFWVPQVKKDKLLVPNDFLENARNVRMAHLEATQEPGFIKIEPSYHEGKPASSYSPAGISIHPYHTKTPEIQKTVTAHEIAHAIDTPSTYENELIWNTMLKGDAFNKQPQFYSEINPNTGNIISNPKDRERRGMAQYVALDPQEFKSDLNALRYLMFDKGIYDIRKGKEFTKEDLERAKEKLKDNESLQRSIDAAGESGFIKLMNVIAKNKEDVTPIAMGGMSIPGSVGFSYARVAGAAPSKGKYAKKTMASAQNGIMSPMLLARNVLNYFYPSEEAAPAVEAAPVEYKKGLTNELLQRQAYKESTFNPAAVSPAGYKGLTQIGEGVLKDYSNKKGGKKLDPFNPEDAVELQKFAMDDLYNASFINKPNQPDSVRIAKTLAAYNWGRGNLANYLNEQKSKGVDIYDSYDWLNNLPKETSDYVNKILLQEDPSFNKNYKKASTNPKYEEVTSLYDQKKFGGDIPSAQRGKNNIEKISINDPRYPEMYKNRQVGLKYDDAISLPDLDEVTVTAKRPSLYEDLRGLTKTVEETAAEFTGVPGTIRFSQDPMKNIKGLIRTGDQTGLGLVGLLPGVEQTGFNYNDQDVEGAFNTLDTFGLASGVAGLARRPIQKGLQQTGKFLTTETPLKNAYRLNPSALKKEDVEFLYRWQADNVPSSLNMRLLDDKFTGRWYESKPTPHYMQIRPGSGQIQTAIVKKGTANIPEEVIRTAKESQSRTERMLPDNVGFNIKRVEENPFDDIDVMDDNFKNVSMKARDLFESTNPKPHWLRGYEETLKPQQTFKSEINWAKWNKEIPENTELMKEYNAIEQTSKANNTWMKNPDGSKFKGTPEQFVQENSRNFKNSNLNSNKTYRVNTRGGDNNPIVHDQSSNIAFTGNEKSARRYITREPRNQPLLSAIDPPSTLGLHELYATGNKRLTIDAKNASYDNVFYNGKNNKTYRIAEESFLNPEINNVNILNVKNHLEGPMSLVEKIIGRKYGNELINKQVPGNYLKSARGNNGMFDMTNPNIYKALVPTAIAAGAIPKKQNGGEMRFYQNGLDWKPKSMKDGGITKDNQGYWNPDNWGQPVEIDSNDITMEGVYEPLLGVSDTGDTKLMQPGKNYKFKGKKVTEFPVAKLGINELDAQPMKKLNQLLNFTNNPDKDNWLDKYN
jgi:hypothetical protein